MKTQRERMLKGVLYSSNDEELRIQARLRKEVISRFNDESNLNSADKEKLLFGLFGHVGNGSFICWPFHCDYGCNVYVGDNFFANYDCIFLDENEIRIGNNVLLGPRVCIFTAGHPIDKDVRNSGLEYAHSVNIGNDVWLGGGVIINPGVKIGNDVIIGSGSVVTENIPSHVVAAGVPCRVMRKITMKDRNYWKKQKQIYDNDFGSFGFVSQKAKP